MIRLILTILNIFTVFFGAITLLATALSSLLKNGDFLQTSDPHNF